MHRKVREKIGGGKYSQKAYSWTDKVNGGQAGGAPEEGDEEHEGCGCAECKAGKKCGCSGH